MMNFSIISSVLILLIALVVAKLCYNVYLSPLRVYPGPKMWSMTRLPWLRHSIGGDLHFAITKLHEKYGPIVRIAPDELSYISGDAWKTIYGHRAEEMPKNLKGAGLMPPHREVCSIITAPKHDHARIRRTISHAFSEKALREQEGFLQLYVNELMSRLRENASKGPQDLVAWFNWTTFDMVGDLSFGEPFGCLKDTQYHPWVSVVFQGVKLIPYIQACLYLKVMPLLQYLAPKSLVEAKQQADGNADLKVERRMAKKDLNRKDFLSYIMRHNDEKGMTEAEIKETAGILIIAGSETTATFLSGAFYLFLYNRRVYELLVKEIRSAFKSESDITMQSVPELKYMNAVIQESFRLYPPAPATFPRMVPGNGEEIEGRWVAGGTTVGVHPFAANHNCHNFYRPYDFLPERFLAPELHVEGDVPSERFANDKTGAMQPFSFGPRNCIGKSLAYAELRLIMAKVLWNFDLDLPTESNNDSWISSQSTAVLWEKPPLLVNLTPVARHETKLGT